VHACVDLDDPWMLALIVSLPSLDLYGSAEFMLYGWEYVRSDSPYYFLLGVVEVDI
jgi:hypothetical protein